MIPHHYMNALVSLVVGVVLGGSALFSAFRSDVNASPLPYVYKMKPYYSRIMWVVIVPCTTAGVYFYLTQREKFWATGLPVLFIVSGLAGVCAWIWARYQVRLLEQNFSAGIFWHETPYADVECIVQITNEASPRAIILLRNARKIKIWSNLIDYDDLMWELRQRCPTAKYEKKMSIWGTRPKVSIWKYLLKK